MFDIQKAAEMLNFIDPISVSYSVWTQVGMALKSALGDSGLSLWESWSAQDPDRYRNGECEKKWKSFSDTGNITVATLFYLAKENGWDDSSKISGLNQKKPAKPESFNKTGINNITETTSRKVYQSQEYLIEVLEAKDGTFRNTIEKAQQNLLEDREGQEYLKSRGLSKNTLDYFKIGTAQNFKYEYLDKSNNAVKYYSVKHVILIPGSYEGYGIRDTGKLTGDKAKYLKTNSSVYPNSLDLPVGLKQVIKEPHKRNLKNGYREPIFICEGYFDAPSFYEIGADAISLNGTGHVQPIIEAFKHFQINRPLILALDNDKEGRRAQTEVYEKFNESGIEVYLPDQISDIYGNYKDANEYLTHNKEEFKQKVEKAKYLPSREFDENLNYRKVRDFNEYINNSVKYPPIPTGFETLDSPDYLDGGLYPGLYILGALSSAGKTTFMLQIADHIASSGHPVLYISLEMLAHELRAKSISRYTHEYILENELPKSYAKTVRDILDRRRYNRYDELEQEIIKDCGNQYFRDTGRNLMILEAESDKSMTVQRIRNLIDLFKKETKKVPVVFIDYLQILDPSEEDRRLFTDKQITDKNVKTLKQLSRDFNTPIFTISSFNRENYNLPVNMASFKESGAIEYSSDVLLGLENSYIITDPKFNSRSPKEQEKIIKEAKNQAKKRARETGMRLVKLVILKNRNGKSGNEINYEYMTKFNYYQELSSKKREELNQNETNKELIEID